MQKLKAAVYLEAFIGLNPTSPKTWSGSIVFLLKAMREAGRLDSVYSLELSTLQRSLLLARSFRANREQWRRNYYFSSGYRQAVTEAAMVTPDSWAVAMQIGSLFSLPRAFPERRCISMHDGNFAERVASGFGLNNLSKAQVEESLRYEEHIAQHMTAICTMSEYLRQSFIKNYHVSPAKVFNVGGAVNIDQIPAEDHSKDYSNKRILFIGAEFARKGGYELLKAFAVVNEKMPNAELHIVGPTDIGKITPGIVFHGHLSKRVPEQKQRLEKLFRESSLFVMPSLYEPYGIAPLEAMLYSIPCVVTNAWALKEIITPNITGKLVEVGSVEELIYTIHDCLSSPEQLKRMGINGRKKVLSDFTWPRVVERIGQVIDAS